MGRRSGGKRAARGINKFNGSSSDRRVGDVGARRLPVTPRRSRPKRCYVMAARVGRLWMERPTVSGVLQVHIGMRYGGHSRSVSYGLGTHVRHFRFEVPLGPDLHSVARHGPLGAGRLFNSWSLCAQQPSVRTVKLSALGGNKSRRHQPPAVGQMRNSFGFDASFSFSTCKMRIRSATLARASALAKR
jgi:hypothetical protein